MSTECDEHLFGPGQKRILALDGGGTLGIIELAFLERIETLLRAARGGDPGFRLCQWFDLIGGTSTGAIIAACLATGMSAGEVTQLYLDLAPRAFRRRRWRITGLTARFDAAPLARFLQEIFGSQTLDSDDIRTGLAIMARRYDTGSPWLISNNPRAPYWHDPPDRRYRGNRHYRLASMIRASTAAPGLFRPELVEIVEGEPAGLFIDGGLSPYNNPFAIAADVEPGASLWTAMEDVAGESVADFSWSRSLSASSRGQHQTAAPGGRSADASPDEYIGGWTASNADVVAMVRRVGATLADQQRDWRSLRRGPRRAAFAPISAI